MASGRRSRRVVAAVSCAVALAFLPRLARAEEYEVAIGFSNLVARLAGADDIGFARPEYRVYILEALRRAGLNAVGAESLVFSRDDAERADLVLGGTVNELACRMTGRTRACRIGIVWEVLNRRSDEVIYRVLSRARAQELSTYDAGAAGKRLVLAAVDSLLRRPRFQSLLSAEGPATPKDATYAPAQFRACEAAPRELPGAFDAVADATLLLKNEDGFGSGFYLGTDGLVLTAAHVVAGQDGIDVHERNGKARRAQVVRVSRAHDVALLSVAGAEAASFPCVELDTAPKRPGSDVYAIGAPSREELAFSLTRGIVSGVRTVEGTRLIQTDASVSPGNSGGPLLDKQGRAVGIVSRKLAGTAVEGVAFGVAIEDALSALQLAPGEATTAGLLHPKEGEWRRVRPHLYADTDDPFLPLDQSPELRPKANWPRVASYSVAGVGALIALASYAQYENQKAGISRSQYQSFRLTNDIGWSLLFAGAAGVVTTYIIEASHAAHPKKSVTVAVGPTSINLGVRY